MKYISGIIAVLFILGLASAVYTTFNPQPHNRNVLRIKEQ